MALIELQRNFMRTLLGPAAVGDGVHPLHNLIVADTKLGVGKRFGIYHHAYRARLLEVMQDVFERTWAYLGDDQFAALATAFIEATPSMDATLNRFGRDFPVWLSVRCAEDAEIAEVATIDWMMRVAFDASDIAAISTEALAGMQAEDWPRAVFELHPSLQITPISYNAGSIWAALESGVAPPPCERLASNAAVIVWRRDVRPHFRVVDAAEAMALQLLQRGESFGNICSAIAEQADEAEPPIGRWLRRWLDEQLVTKVKVPD